MRRSLLLLLVTSALAACDSPLPVDADRDAAPGDDAHVRDASGLELIGRLAGLWTGPATMTRLGDFPLMNLDFRAASPGMLFGRVDLDDENSLRLAFDVEHLDGRDVLVFRNGGLFMGLARDTRTILVEHDAGAGRYRFCAREPEGGCGYTDATWTFTGATEVTLEVLVRGTPHLRWDARRAEERTLPTPFPSPDAPIGDGTEPFPPMPSLELRVTWTSPLASDADVWIILATSACISSACTPSRWMRARARAGSTSATLVIDQIHAGAYLGTAILDRDGNVASTLRPGPGDAVSIPDTSITVSVSGASSSTLAIIAEL